MAPTSCGQTIRRTNIFFGKFLRIRIDLFLFVANNMFFVIIFLFLLNFVHNNHQVLGDPSTDNKDLIDSIASNQTVASDNRNSAALSHSSKLNRFIRSPEDVQPASASSSSTLSNLWNVFHWFRPSDRMSVGFFPVHEDRSTIVSKQRGSDGRRRGGRFRFRNTNHFIPIRGKKSVETIDDFEDSETDQTRRRPIVLILLLLKSNKDQLLPELDD